MALSSAEAELYGLVWASAEILGTMSMFQDFGQEVPGRVWGDASAALAIVNRQGVGKLRHLDTQFLWVQEKATQARLHYSKVHGKENAADLMTKVLTWEEVRRHSEKLGVTFAGEEVQETMRKEVFALARKLDRPGSIRYWTRVD